ncbi:hypothetical protein [Ralstonia solanacearum]|uniref:hypothetical protein n=1 Tax=Ralstonia solanacearum TaxID=305 RepID=UPI00078B4497|nr:hypothetical protein [Ralstonia solanacearum]AMP36821.1 hypothetical protein LBM2029_04380 [Ralstonia solanacearum]AXV85626.1 hypothetical protein CJO78_04565 [Ralstonia solanacearum]AXW05135.1 hypothetical protein CJO82_04340 [Ralstonia solanacearum]AXW22879.1 hypothetical protein CJO86_04365 [Ralstonia solanacearum]AXW79826.1 hypothetical protein CJO98_04585 [Ralstonia solanacearum]
MRKLYQLKKWYTVGEAAKRLTLTLDERVDSTDVFRLMADGELSVFWYVRGRDGVEVAPANWYVTEDDLDEDEEYPEVPTAYLSVSRQSEKVSFLDGVYRVETEVCRGSLDWVISLATGQGGNIASLCGTLLIDEQGRMWELLERLDERRRRDLPEGLPYDDVGHYKISSGRPRIEEIVITKQEIERFEAQFLAEPQQSLAGGGFQSDERWRGVWPWGNHETKLLRALAEAGEQWWSTYDQDDKTTAPTNEDVAAWLRQKHGVAARVAEVMAQVLRADDIPQGPRRR